MQETKSNTFCYEVVHNARWMDSYRVIVLIPTLMWWQTRKFPNWHYLPFQQKSSAHVVLSCADAGCTWKRLHLLPWWHSHSIWHQVYEHLSPLSHLSPADHINTPSIQTNDAGAQCAPLWLLPMPILSGAPKTRVQLPLLHSHHVYEMPAAENMLNYVEPFYESC